MSIILCWFDVSKLNKILSWGICKCADKMVYSNRWMYQCMCALGRCFTFYNLHNHLLVIVLDTNERFLPNSVYKYILKLYQLKLKVNSNN